MLEFKNEFLELLKMPPKKDFLVYLWADDCPKCREHMPFFDEVANQVSEASNVHVA